MDNNATGVVPVMNVAAKLKRKLRLQVVKQTAILMP